MVTRIVLENFTAFEHADIEFDAGVNVIIGENSTGKTHLMKAVYAACAVESMREERTFDQKLKTVFIRIRLEGWYTVVPEEAKERLQSIKRKKKK